MNRRRALAIAAAVAATIVWRVVLLRLTPVPGEDGVAYLWLARRFAAGDFAAGFGDVFPPGFPLLLAPWLWLGGEPFATAQWFGIVCAAATVPVLVALARRIAPDGALAVAWLWAFAPLLARLSVEVFAEPPFLLVVALGTLAGMRQRWWLTGLAGAVAFWIRPEGLLLPIAFVLAHRTPALRALAATLAGVLAFAGARWLGGHGFDPLPLLAFHEQRDDLPERGRVLTNLLAVPGGWFEAFAVTGLLALYALRRWRERDVQALGWQSLLQVGAICTFVVRRRFFLSAAVPMHALAAPALAALRPRCRWLLVGVLAVVGGVLGVRGVTEPDRIGERELGRWLLPQLAGDDQLVTDLARVGWYAGRRPPPPRKFTTETLLAQAHEPAVRFVVVADRREGFAALAAGLAGDFVPVALPDGLAQLAAARGIAVFARR